MALSASPKVEIEFDAGVWTDVSALSGAELVTSDDWCGLRSHPAVAGTVSFGGPDVPAWVDGAVRRLVGGEFE